MLQSQDRFVNEQKLESNKYLIFHKTVFLGDNVLEAKQHWTNFEKYVNTQQHYNITASRAELCDAFANTLLCHAYRWFQTMVVMILPILMICKSHFLQKFNK